MPQATGTQSVDANNRVITTPYTISAVDATGTPVPSPLVAQTTTPKAIIIPAGAIWMNIAPVALARFGTNATLDGSSAAKSYAYAPANVVTRIPVAGAGTIYLAADASTVTISFWFETLGS